MKVNVHFTTEIPDDRLDDFNRAAESMGCSGGTKKQNIRKAVKQLSMDGPDKLFEFVQDLDEEREGENPEEVEVEPSGVGFENPAEAGAWDRPSD